MSEVIQLRNGERIRPEEFPADHLEPLHETLDAIRDERYPVNEAIDRFVSRPAVATTLLVIGGFLFGLAAATGVR